LGFRCGQQSSQPATTASGFDRKATRNPQLHIVPSVNAKHRGFANKLLRQVFAGFKRTFFISGGDIYAEDFSSFDSLEFNERAKRWPTAFRVSTESFSFRQRLLKNCSAESFSGLDSFVFHFVGEFYPTDNYEENARIRLDKILIKKILEEIIMTEMNA